MYLKENAKINTSEKGGPIKFFKEIKAEVNRITWPSKEDIKKSLMAVGVVVFIFAMLTGGLDWIFQNFFKLIFKL